MQLESQNGRQAQPNRSALWTLARRSDRGRRESPEEATREAREDRRGARRYDLHLPGEIWKTRKPEIRQEALTANISSGGVLFVLAESGIQEYRLRERIQFRVYLLTNQMEAFDVILWGSGRVVRIAHQVNTEWPRQIAVELEHHQVVREVIRQDTGSCRGTS